MAKIKFNALIKQFSRRQLLSLDSEVEIKIRTSDLGIVPGLNELSRADKEVSITIEDSDE